MTDTERCPRCRRRLVASDGGCRCPCPPRCLSHLKSRITGEQFACNCAQSNPAHARRVAIIESTKRKP